jgi:hypothetical protein
MLVSPTGMMRMFTQQSLAHGFRHVVWSIHKKGIKMNMKMMLMMMVMMTMMMTTMMMTTMMMMTMMTMTMTMMMMMMTMVMMMMMMLMHKCCKLLREAIGKRQLALE